MTIGISTRGSRILVGAIALMMGASATFAGTLIPLSPRFGGDNIQPVPPVSGGGPGGNNILANTENDWTGSGTGNVTTGSNWSLTHVPTVSEDAVFNSSSTAGIKNFGTGATVGPALTVGSLDVTAVTGTYSIRNATTSATNASLTLGGAGATGNSVSGTSTDLLFAATGSTLALLGDNPNGLGVLQVFLGQSGSFNAAGTINVTAVISDGASSFGITKSGAGILLLSGANTYDGGLTLSAGTLRFNNAAAAGTGTFTINGGTLTNTSAGAITATNAVTWGGDFTFDGSASTNSMTFSGPVTLTGNRAVNVSGTTSSLTISGSIGGAFSLTKGGPGLGTLVLSTANTYTGGTILASGTLLANADGAFGTGNVSLTGSTVKMTLQFGALNNYIADAASLSYISGDLITLNYIGTDTVAGLTVDGVAQGAGVYGASFINPDGVFAGTGSITVVPEPTTVAMMVLGGSLLVGMQRFRRKLR